jgi:hypothetical protein
MRADPVAILAVLQALLALVVGFGLDLTAEQVGLIMAFASAVFGLFARSKVSPVPTPPPPLDE